MSSKLLRNLCLPSILLGAAIYVQAQSAATANKPRLPATIAEAAEAGRKEAVAADAKSATPTPLAPGSAAPIPMNGPLPPQLSRNLPAAAPSFYPLPPARPRSDQMDLLRIVDIGNTHVAGIRVMNYVNYVTVGGNLGNGWTLKTINGNNVILEGTETVPGPAPVVTEGKKTPKTTQPPPLITRSTYRTLLLDAGTQTMTQSVGAYQPGSGQPMSANQAAMPYPVQAMQQGQAYPAYAPGQVPNFQAPSYPVAPVTPIR